MSKGMITKFPVSTPAYPWDLIEHGVEGFLDGAIEHIGANAVFSPVCYYMEEASAFWWGGVMPHNKKIRRYFPEDGKFYIEPDLKHYKDTKIKPDKSTDPLLAGFDVLRALEKPIKERGMKMSAWFPMFKNPYLARKYPDCTPIDIFGGRQKHGLCPNHPDVRGYITGTIKNIVLNYKVDSIGMDKFGIEYWAGGPQGEGWYNQINNGYKWSADIDPQFLLLGAPCFCEHCAKQAKEWNFDWDFIVKRIKILADGCVNRDPSVTFELSKKGFFEGEAGLARLILEETAVYQWLRFRMKTMVEMAREVKNTLLKFAPQVELGVGLDPSVGPNFQRFRHYGFLYGALLKDIAGIVDAISGSSGWSIEEKAYMASIDKEAVEGKCKFRIGDVHAVYPANPEHVRKQIETFHKLGSDGYCVFGYTWAPLENLHAAKEALQKIERSER